MRATALQIAMALLSCGFAFSCHKEEVSLGKINKMIAIGDSITCGTYVEAFTADDAVWGKASPTFSEIIKNELGCETLINYGADGISVSSVGQPDPDYSLCRYIDSFETGDLVLIAAGTNDYGNYEGVELGKPSDRTDISFYGGLHVFLDKVKAKYAGARVYIITPMHRQTEGKNAKGYTLSDYRKAIEEKAKEFDFPVIDGTKIPIDPTKVEHRRSYILDGLHPNAVGHAFYAEYVLEQIFEKEKER